MWLDDCRIPFIDEIRTIPVHSEDNKIDVTLFGLHPTIQHKREKTTQGRYTPNLLVCDNMLNDVIKPKKGYNDKSKVTSYVEFGGVESEYHDISEYKEVNSKSRYYDLDNWFDKMIDEL